MPNGRVTHAEREGWHVLRYFGRVDYTMAPAIDRFADGLFHEQPTCRFVFDLSEAKLVDSTNLGLMARLAERANVSEGADHFSDGDQGIHDGCEPRFRSIIVSNNDDINDVLESMGFRDVFRIVAEDPTGHPDDGESEVTGERCSQGELLRTMLDAHRTLSGLNEKDREQFKDVVSMLEAETSPR